MAGLKTVVRFLDETLDVASFPGDAALNGLQVEGSRRVQAAAFAVDACRESIARAIRARAELLVVHHGLLWGARAPLTGILAARVGMLLRGGLSLYAAHLPLDCHPELGNNARIAALIGLGDTEPFGLYAGARIGLRGELPRPAGVRGLAARLGRAFGAQVRAFPFGPARVRRLGIVSGGGASLVQAAAEAGCDALLTGESSHASYHVARENRINLFCAGHYATETAGVRALADLLGERFGLRTVFIDLPTGL